MIRLAAMTKHDSPVNDVYPLRQVNLVVSDLERSQTFYSRFGWQFRRMGDAALIADAAGVLLALHLPDFVRMWNEGYDGRTGGLRCSTSISPTVSRSTDSMRSSQPRGTPRARSRSMPSSARATRSWRTLTAISSA
jgi:hypothetical protein